ncbi:hypothetical protein [Nonomuraea sp. NPDC049646]|uniref:hypothetical protein n=1 Tax=unclassified Nonomuraea TaxID=2593643 RepID=UPI0037BB624B
MTRNCPDLDLLNDVRGVRAGQHGRRGLSDVLKPDHPRTLPARTNLAGDHFATGRFQEAYDIDTEVLELGI